LKNRAIYLSCFFLFLLMIAVTISSAAAPALNLLYVIQQGDTLSEIAADYGISVSELIKANDLVGHSAIKMGDELVIPVKNTDQNTVKAPDLMAAFSSRDQQLNFDLNTHYAVRINVNKQKVNIDQIPADKIINYYVGRGDTLYDLARDFSTTIGTILALNNKSDNYLRVGERIRLPINNLTPHQVLNHRVSKKELDLLARAVYGEARGEPYQGQVAVAAVIINRVLNWQFPNTFAEVIYQRGQFSAVMDGQINLAPNQTAYRAARDALRGIDPTGGALYFYNPRTATRVSFFRGRRKITKIGDHVFMK
jgi:N-acetylmuramoyl-L-alanine amidase